MKLTHLCKCSEYYIEEYEVPDGSVFILPKLEGNTCESGYMQVNKNGKLECHPIKAIKVCDCDDNTPESSPPVIIEDLPTKQAFIKKDLKYNTIITDQRTTFELFLTKEEAVQTWLEDNDFEENAEQQALDQKASRVKISVEARAAAPKKEKQTRTTKVSDEKKALFDEIRSNLEDIYQGNVTVLKENKLLEVKIGEKKFKIDIIETRAKKQ
jgi:hypothetical protein